MKKYKNVKVGQVWKETANGDADLVIIEIGKNISMVNRDSIALHAADSDWNTKILVAFSQSGSDDGIMTYDDFIDYCTSNCFEVV